MCRLQRVGNFNRKFNSIFLFFGTTGPFPQLPHTVLSQKQKKQKQNKTKISTTCKLTVMYSAITFFLLFIFGIIVYPEFSVRSHNLRMAIGRNVVLTFQQQQKTEYCVRQLGKRAHGPEEQKKKKNGTMELQEGSRLLSNLILT